MENLKLSEYVKTSLANGKPKEEIYKDLLAKGWTIDVIQSSFLTNLQSQDIEDNSKKTISVILTIGTILVGAGVFSFIAANWAEMTKPVKIGIIVFSMVTSYFAGWYFKEKSNLHKTGDALIFLGSIIYGSGIFLVAQMFNIRATWPDGFILWMIGLIAMAFATELYPLFYFAIILGVCALVGYPFGFMFFGSNPFLLTSSFLLLFATILTFATGWIVRKKIPADLKDFY